MQARAGLVANERIPLTHFFNLAGAAQYPDDWDVRTVYDLNRSLSESLNNKAVNRALELEYNLSQAAAESRIRIEVDLTRIPSEYEDFVRRDGRLLYWRIRSEAWRPGGAEIDWANGTVSTKMSELDPPDYAFAGMMGESFYELVGYVNDPAGALNGLVKPLAATITYHEFASANKHLWSEIMALIWRYITIHGPLTRASGQTARLVQHVRNYYIAKGQTDLQPSESQLREAIEFVREQAGAALSDGPVIPNFAQERRKAKERTLQNPKRQKAKRMSAERARQLAEDVPSLEE